MAWPSASIDTTALDAGTDSPATARNAILTTAQQVNTIRGARGAADGVAPTDSDSLVPRANLPFVLCERAPTVYSTPGSYSYTVPAGATKLLAMIVGAGGGGAHVSAGTGGDHGGGGGAGGVAFKWFAVVPGSVFSVTVGAKGAGGSASGDNDGGNGGESNIVSPASATPASTTVRAYGGTGGKSAPTRFGGGAGGSLAGDLSFPGGAGASGEARGGMGGSNFAAGGSAGSSGYGGAGGFGSGSGTPGFDGLDGVVIFFA